MGSIRPDLRNVMALAGAMWLLAAGSAQAQCRLCSEDSKVKQQVQAKTPLRIEISANLDFSRVAATRMTGGDVSVDPHSGQRSVSGAVIDLGGFALKGAANLTGEPGRYVRIELPDRIILNAPNGATAEVINLRTSLSAQPRLDENGLLDFTFGGRLVVTGSGYGSFRGRIPITATYE